MFDYEGSRSEFLMLLAQFGEEPAFIARARASQIALYALLTACAAKRDEMLKWPTFHLSALAKQIGNDWFRIASLLIVPESVTMLAALHAKMPANKSIAGSWLASDKASLCRYLGSAERFNRAWVAYVDSRDFEAVNRPRREFNQFYLLEKECAFGRARITDGFEPLELIDREYLHGRFPLRTIPVLV